MQKARHADSLKRLNQPQGKSFLRQPDNPDYKYGTVGAVALDKHGNLAAATSTGGMTNKRYGRIGDSPIIGAGTYANNNTCAISSTGWGEYFIRLVMAKSISDRIELADETLLAITAIEIEHLPVGIESVSRFGMAGTRGSAAIVWGHAAGAELLRGRRRAFGERSGRVGT